MLFINLKNIFIGIFFGGGGGLEEYLGLLEEGGCWWYLKYELLKYLGLIIKNDLMV